jgi:hypothetical protein
MGVVVYLGSFLVLVVLLTLLVFLLIFIVVCLDDTALIQLVLLLHLMMYAPMQCGPFYLFGVVDALGSTLLPCGRFVILLLSPFHDRKEFFLFCCLILLFCTFVTLLIFPLLYCAYTCSQCHYCHGLL